MVTQAYLATHLLLIAGRGAATVMALAELHAAPLLADRIPGIRWGFRPLRPS